MSPLLAFNLGTPEIIAILIVGVLLFGRRLPEVGRYIGKGLVEFKKGLHGLEDDIDHGIQAQMPPPARPPQPASTPKPGDLGDTGSPAHGE